MSPKGYEMSRLIVAAGRNMRGGTFESGDQIDAFSFRRTSIEQKVVEFRHSVGPPMRRG